MRSTIRRLFPLAALSLLLLAAGAALLPPRAGRAEEQSPEEAAEKPALTDFDFMAGSWVMDDGHGSIWEEHWFGARGGSLVGLTRWVEEGKTRLYEASAIEERPDGIRFTLRHFGEGLLPKVVDGRDSLEWRLDSLKKDHAVFLGEYEFPKRIVYRKDGADLVVSLLGKNGDRDLAVEFRFHPAKAK